MISQRGFIWRLDGIRKICDGSACRNRPLGENRMKIAVRLDDITPDMDWERFYKFKALLDRYQVKPLIGVVPDNRDPGLVKKQEPDRQTPEDFWEYVKELKRHGWVIAMHGCHHVYTTDRGGLFPLNNFSEFAGLPFEQQKKLLAEGKDLLAEKGIETELFMAPAHSYDKNTLKALKETGFQGLTDGFGDFPYYFRGLAFYPISFMLGRTFRKKEGYSTMVVHTGTVSEEDLKRYESYFQRQDVSWISFEEYLKIPGGKRGIWGRWKEFGMAKGKYLMGRFRGL